MSGLRQARRPRRSADRSASRSRRNVRWRREYGGLKVDQARRLKALEKENLRLRKVVACDEARLTADIIRLAEQYGRYGYRRITALLRREGWTVNAKRGERIWRR